MVHLFSFDDFLKESVMTHVTSSTKFVENILRKAKSEKLVKYIAPAEPERPMYRNHAGRLAHTTPTWMRGTGSGFMTDRGPGEQKASRATGVLSLGSQYFEIAPLMFDKSNWDEKTKHLSSIDVIVASRTSFSLADIEKLFPEEIEASSGTKPLMFKRSLSKDHSKTQGEMNVHVGTWDAAAAKYNYATKPDKPCYYVVFSYKKEEKSSTDEISFDIVTSLPEFKDLLKKYPLVVNSTKIQRKKGIISMVFPTKFVIFPETNNWFGNPDKDYLNKGFSIFSSGTVREILVNHGGMAKDVGKFDASSIEGWKKGIGIVKTKLNELKAKIAKEGGKLLVDEEDKHNHRGMISGRSYGI